MKQGMEFKGTKSLWEVSKEGVYRNEYGVDAILIDFTSINEVDCIEIYSKLGEDNGNEELIANAQLIATAPELIEALIEDQEMIKTMLENNMGGGRHIGKTYLSKRWEANQMLINKALGLYTP